MTVADTHAIVWWILSPSRLSLAARAAFDDQVHLSVISCFEITNLARRGRITLPRPAVQWLDAVFHLPNVTLAPITLDIAVAAGALGDPIRDPADRLITATALDLRVPLITADANSHAAGVVETIW